MAAHPNVGEGRLPPPAGARKGLPYNAAAVPLRTTRTNLHGIVVICPGLRPSEISRSHRRLLLPQALKERPAASTPSLTVARQ